MSGPDSKFDPKLQHRRTIVCSADLRTLSDPKSMLKGSESDKFDIPEGTKSYIPVDKLIIPDGYTELPAMNVLVAGMTESGKTIYLSSLMNMINTRLALKITSPDILVKMPFDAYGAISDYARAREISQKGRELMSAALDEYEAMRTIPGRTI